MTVSSFCPIIDFAAGKGDLGYSSASKSENDDISRSKPVDAFKGQLLKTKSLFQSTNGEKVESNSRDRNQTLSDSQFLPVALHKHSSVSSSPALARPETPVDISDRQGLLSSPHSSQTSEGSKKHKKQKHRHHDERDKKTKVETNGWDERSRSSSQDSSEKRKKKRKHKKEKRRRRDPSSSDSESEREERKKQSKRRQYSRMNSSSDSGTSDSGGSKRHKKNRTKEDSDGYEWVEVTKESSSGKCKGSNNRGNLSFCMCQV